MVRNCCSLALAIVLGIVAGVPLAPSPADAQAHLVGEWRTLPYQMPINPIHAALLRTGKVLIVAGSENDPTITTYRAAVWDTQAGTIAVQQVPWDLFCNAISFLPDGRALIVGGTLQYDPFRGLKTTAIFDPATEKFIRVHDMTRGRWYPTNAVLDDGGIMTFSGILDTGGTNTAVEIYDAPWGWSPEMPAGWTPPLYPWLHLLPSGKVFYPGPTIDSHLFDPATGLWTLNVARTNYARRRTFGASVLLPLTPERNYAPRVVILGGDNPATASAEMIDLSSPNPAWRSLAPMSAPRIELNAVLLPTGRVLALGGSAQDNVASTASLAADLFDPETETWSPAGVASYARMYHSTALLLPDATVMVAGSNPSRGVWERSLEIYSPAYLFTTNGQRAPRPTITAAPARIGYGAAFQLDTPDAADVASVVLVRPGATTHAFDMEQRLVGLTFVAQNGALSVDGPPSSRLAPPGHYMVFVVNRNGVPSVAKFVQLASSPANATPQGAIANPSADITVGAGQPVTFAGDGVDVDGTVTGFSWVFPGGSPGASTAKNPGGVVFSTPGIYVVSLTVVDNLGTNDPSPPTRTITVVPAAVDLVETSVSNPPVTAAPGGSFAVTDTARNQGTGTAGSTTTRYYLSLDTTWSSNDVLLTGSRSVPTLVPNNQSTGTVTVTISSSTALGTYSLLACADDTKIAAESNEGNNCVASAATVRVEATQAARPDLVVTTVTSPSTVVRGQSLQITDTTRNQGTVSAGGSRNRYYLSADPAMNGDKRLNGRRDVPSLAAGAQSTGTVAVAVPKNTTPGVYYLISCADDQVAVSESDETNNCTASATRVTVQ
jgi:hypothetical protein